MASETTIVYAKIARNCSCQAWNNFVTFLQHCLAGDPLAKLKNNKLFEDSWDGT